MKTKLTFAFVALITGTAFGSMPAVLPEFKNAKQLAEWRAEMAEKASATTSTSDVRSSALDAPSAFYTGRPYVESSGGYVFKYRSYNPELARWTSEDPSGFPDGSNSNIYAPTPTNSIDLMGLNTIYPLEDLNVVKAVITGWESLDYTFSARLANHSFDTSPDNITRQAEDDEISALQGASAFTDRFKISWWDQYYGSQGVGTYTWQENIDYGGGLGVGSDLHLSYGHVTFEFSVAVASCANSGGFSYDVDFNFSDTYNFNPNTDINPIRAFDALQTAGIATIYESEGSFNIVYE